MIQAFSRLQSQPLPPADAMARGKRSDELAAEVVKPEQADKMLVHIQGFSGLHPIRTGIAYWYRGRYLYGSIGNPIEPQPFATKGKLVLSGSVCETAPKYDEQDPTLKPEYTVGALYKAMWDQGYFAPPSHDLGESDVKNEDEVVAIGDKAPAVATAIDQQLDGYDSAYGGKTTAHPQVQLPVGTGRPNIRTESSEMPGYLTASNSALSLNQLLFRYPHDASHFLAASAPGSRFGSRNVSALPTPMASPVLTPLEEQSGFQFTVSSPHSRRASRSGVTFMHSHSRQASIHSRHASNHSGRGSRQSSGYSSGQISCPFSGTRSVQEARNGCGNDRDHNPEPRSLHELVRSSVPASPFQPRDNSLPNVSLPSSPNVSRAVSPVGYGAPSTFNPGMRTLLRSRMDQWAGVGEKHPLQPGISSLKQYSTKPPSIEAGSRSGSVLGSAGFLAPPSIHTSEHRGIGSQRSLTSTPLPRRERSKLAYEASKLSPYLLPRRSSSYGGSSTITDGSLRDKASLALNEAYNAARVTKCPLHGEDCDGATVTSTHLTEQTRLTLGFRDLYPSKEQMGRMMIDWERIFKEEKDAMEVAAKRMGMRRI